MFVAGWEGRWIRGEGRGEGGNRRVVFFGRLLVILVEGILGCLLFWMWG